MDLADARFLSGFLWLAEEGARRGWHEANGGNLSYRLHDSEADALDGSRVAARRVPLSIHVPALAGAHIALSASGARMGDLSLAVEESLGVIEIDGAGSSYAVIAGFDGTFPTSETEAHLAAHHARLRAGAHNERVVYHAHCPFAVALSAVLEADVRTWSSTLWRSLSECVYAIPRGIACLPYIAPGSTGLAAETGKAMANHAVCVWANHGVVASATEFDEALDKMESVEKAAQVYLTARSACGGREPSHLISIEALRTYCTQAGIDANLELLD